LDAIASLEHTIILVILWEAIEMIFESFDSMCFDHISGVPMKTKIEGQVLCCIKVVSNIVTLGLRSKGNIYVSICTSNKSRHNEQLKERGN
jgi:hypothetical protein